MDKLKGFISYAREDELYFTLIKDGLRKHGKHSHLIDSDLWHDEKVTLGSPWHQSIQEQVKGCDFAVFLVSSDFLASDYIEEHEFKAFLKRQDEEGFLFFPLLIAPCNFDHWERLAVRQFFKPDGNAYNAPEAGTSFTFSHLVQWNTHTGNVFPNPYREQYFMDALAKIEEALRDYRQRKSSPLHLPTSSYFQIQHVSLILPEHILETRAKPSQGYRPYYLYRQYIDERLRYNFQQGHHTIITGKPLAGKSRAVLELCHSLEEDNVQVWFPLRRDFRMEDFRLPDTDADVLLFIDDFDQFLHLENLDLALGAALLRPNIRVIATCRKSELPKVEEHLSDLMPNFEINEILPLNPAEEAEVHKEAPDRVRPKSDGTTGGYFFPLVEMQKRYNRLPINGLEREILHACKALRLWGLTEPGGSFSKEKIENYCLKRLELYYGQHREVPPFEWDRAFQVLSQKDLLANTDSMVVVEELYLENFIKATNSELGKEILHFFPSVINYTKALNKVLDFEQARSVLETMKKEGLKPNVVTFNSLLNKAPDIEQARSVLETMKEEGLKPDVVTFNSLLNKAPDFEQARSVLETMKEDGLKPDMVTFNSLLSKAPDFEQARSVLETIKEEGLKPNVVTFSSLLSKAPDFEQASNVLDTIKKEGLKPNVVTFNSLLSKAPDFKQARSVLETMKKEGLKPDVVTFSSLLSKASDFEKASSVLETMKKEGLKPDVVTFSSLLSKAPDFEQARSVLETMKEEGLKPNVVTVNSLLSKAPDFEKARSVLETMKKEGLKLDEFTFNSLLSKAPDFEQARSVLETMKKEGLKPDKVTFSSLISKAPDFEKASSVLETMKKDGLKPDKVTFSSLLSKASDLEQARNVLETMEKDGLKPNEFTYNFLISKAPNFEKACSVLETMKKDGLKPDKVTFSSLLSKAPDFEKASSVLETMKEEGLKPDVVTFNSLLSKAPDFEQARSVIETIKEEGLKPDVITFNSLLSKAPDFEQARSVIETIKEEGLKPDEFTFNSLLSKASNFEQARSVIEIMKEMGLKPDKFTLNSLLNKAPDFEQAIMVMELARHFQISPSREMISSLLKIAKLKKRQPLDKIAESIFFKQYFPLLAKQEDPVIRTFAEAMKVSAHRAKLLECLKEKNWWYWKLKADMAIADDWASAFRYLDSALDDIPASHMTHIHAIWAKNTVFNDLQEHFEEAANRCWQALEMQPKGNVPYTGKLLLWLILRRHADFETAISEVKKTAEHFEFSKKPLNLFLKISLWEELPAAPIAHWKKNLQEWINLEFEQ